MNRTQANGSRAKVATADKDGAAGRAKVEDAVRVILRHIGEDPDREGLERTPARVVKAYEFLTSGYAKDPKEAINGALFSEEDYQEIILCKDLDFYSLCEHHLLPFMGKAHVGVPAESQNQSESRNWRGWSRFTRDACRCRSG